MSRKSSHTSYICTTRKKECLCKLAKKPHYKPAAHLFACPRLNLHQHVHLHWMTKSPCIILGGTGSKRLLHRWRPPCLSPGARGPRGETPRPNGPNPPTAARCLRGQESVRQGSVHQEGVPAGVPREGAEGKQGLREGANSYSLAICIARQFMRYISTCQYLRKVEGISYLKCVSCAWT